MRVVWFISVLVSCVVPVALLAQQITMPAGARLVLEQETNPGSYALPIGPFADGTIPVEVFEGQISEQVWRVPGRGLTNLQLLAPIRAQIVQSGFEIRLDCASRRCGGFDFRFETRVLPGPEMYVDLTNFRFLSATASDGRAISLLVSRSASSAYLQLIRVGDVGEVASGRGPAPTPVQPAAPTGPFGETLERHGRVVLSDLSFDTGASTLGQGSFDSLKNIASYLAANPGRKIALVGHTDSVGSLEGNINLSRRRAASVLERLVTEYGVGRSQLEAGGMGYLAPFTTNLTAAGREANRRVEAVLVSTE